MLRVLLIADACSPHIPSVPLQAYLLTRALARRSDLEILLATNRYNEAVLKNDPIAKEVRIEYVPRDELAVWFINTGNRLRKPGLSYTTAMAFNFPGYLRFESHLRYLVRDRFRDGTIDIVHRIAPNSPVMASRLAYLENVPMVVGPLNGGLPWPKEYSDLGRREAEPLRKIRFLYRYSYFHRRMYRHLAGVIAGSRHTATEIPDYFRGRTYYIPDNGVDPERTPFADGWPEPDGAFRFVTVGRLVPYKAMDLAIEALAGSAVLKSCRLTVVGDGPYRDYLVGLAAERGVADRVEFLGNVDHQRVGEVLRRSQAFVFPSLREFGGAVVIEAMASGVPPIAVNYGGPGEHVTPETGLLIPLCRREELVVKLRQAMERLFLDHDLCRTFARNAIRRVKDVYTWDEKAAQIVAVYNDILDDRAGKTQAPRDKSGVA